MDSGERLVLVKPVTLCAERTEQIVVKQNQWQEKRKAIKAEDEMDWSGSELEVVRRIAVVEAPLPMLAN